MRPNLRDSLFTEFFNPQSFRHDVSITSRRTDDDSRFCSSVVKFFIHNLSFYEMEIAAALKGNHLLHGFALFFSNQMVFVFVLNFWKGQFSISSETKLHPVYLSNLTLQLSPCTVSTLYYPSLKSLITNRLKMLDKNSQKLIFGIKPFEP